MQERQPAPDPFFEQLKADVDEGLAAADRGEVVDADDVWAELRARTRDIELERKGASPDA